MPFNLVCFLVAAAASLSFPEIIQGVVSSTLEDPLDSVRITVKEAPGVTAFSDAKGAFTLNTASTILRPARRGVMGGPAWHWNSQAARTSGETGAQPRDMAWHTLQGRWLGSPQPPPAGIFFGLTPTASHPGAVLAKTAGTVTLVFEKAGYVKTEMVSQATPPAMQVVLEYSDLKVKAKADYKKNYTGSNVSLAELAWTGDTASCNAGTISDLAQTRTVIRLNYFRRLAGLTPITFTAALNARCQKAALMMAANKTLNHTPPTTWRCYTQEGADGAGSSNLAGGSHSSQSMTQYMMDEGDNNTAAGHRRWILNPLVQEMGSGSTGNYNALATFGKNFPSYPATTPAFVAWPSAGYFPATLAAPRWTFSVHNKADLSAAQVEMTGPGGKATLQTLNPYFTGYGEATIVWEPKDIDTKNAQDVTYNVKVTGVKGGRADGTYTYQVVLFRP